MFANNRCLNTLFRNYMAIKKKKTYYNEYRLEIGLKYDDSEQAKVAKIVLNTN